MSELHPLHCEVHSESAPNGDICTEYVQFALLNVHVLSKVRIGAYVGCGPVFSAVVYIAVQTNAAREALRAATTTSQYMTSVQPFYSGPIVCG